MEHCHWNLNYHELLSRPHSDIYFHAQSPARSTVVTREAVCIHMSNYAARVKKVQPLSAFHNTVHRQSFHFDTGHICAWAYQCDGAFPSA